MNHQIIDVALAVIRDARGRYLVAQRPASADYADYWEFPGGKREAGENRLQVLQRECSEELGITVQNARPLFRWSYQYSDRHVRLDAWLIYRYNGEAHGAEGQQVRWLHPAEFDDFRFLDANDGVGVEDDAGDALELRGDHEQVRHDAERLPVLAAERHHVLTHGGVVGDGERQREQVVLRRRRVDGVGVVEERQPVEADGVRLHGVAEQLVGPLGAGTAELLDLHVREPELLVLQLLAAD